MPPIHNHPPSSRRTPLGRRPRVDGVTPSPAAHAELTWFFNDAARDLEGPPLDALTLSGASPGGLWPIERVAEAFHAASKIHARLRAISEADVRALDDLYTQRLFGRVLPLFALGRIDQMRARAAALRAYEEARGHGPSVAPELDSR